MTAENESLNTQPAPSQPAPAAAEATPVSKQAAKTDVPEAPMTLTEVQTELRRLFTGGKRLMLSALDGFLTSVGPQDDPPKKKG